MNYLALGDPTSGFSLARSGSNSRNLSDSSRSRPPRQGRASLPSRRLRRAGPAHGGRHAPPPRVAPAPTPGQRRAPPGHPANPPLRSPASQVPRSPAPPLAPGALEGSGPRRALLTLFLDGRRFALQVGVEPRDLATKCVGTVLDLEKSMTFGRIEDGF